MSTAATAATPAPKIDAKPLLVRRAAVLGAGTMGSRIAAHLANAGIPVLLLDLPAARALDGAFKIQACRLL
jgi:3-hydroxyacyl-CoA dehydrogenase